MTRHGIIRRLAALAGALLLSTPALAADQPPTSWARCAMCHSVTPGKSAGIGPNLAGVVGRNAASRPGFTYSPALKASNVVWTPARLDAFLTKPQALVPGNKMMFVGLPDAKMRAEIIRYLQGTR